MRFFDDWNTRRRLRTTGQALILIVLTFMGLLLFLGLMVDLGQIFLAKGYLRRAADAGALAAAAQFRESRTIGEMTAAALEVAHINGIDFRSRPAKRAAQAPTRRYARTPGTCRARRCG
jgi:uncharacterized membrane protein